MHNRRWCVSAAASPEDLAEKLTNHAWTLCTAFRVEGHPDYVFLDDATSEDGALEVAVLKADAGAYRQVESITFSWCSREQALEYIRDCLAGAYDAQAGKPIRPTLQTPQEHGTCHNCA